MDDASSILARSANLKMKKEEIYDKTNGELENFLFTSDGIGRELKKHVFYELIYRAIYKKNGKFSDVNGVVKYTQISLPRCFGFGFSLKSFLFAFSISALIGIVILSFWEGIVWLIIKFWIN